MGTLLMQLWEESQQENARLRLEMEGIREELEEAREKLKEALRVPSYSAALFPSSGEAEERKERTALERKLERMEAEIQELHNLREENEELRTQNSSLSLAIAKMASRVRKTTRV